MNWRDSIWASDNRSYLGVPTAVSYAALSYLWKRTHYTWITKASKFTTAFPNSPSWLNLRWEQKIVSQSAGGSASAMMIKHHFKHTAAADEWVFNEGQQWGVASQTHSTLGEGGEEVRVYYLACDACSTEWTWLWFWRPSLPLWTPGSPGQPRHQEWCLLWEEEGRTGKNKNENRTGLLCKRTCKPAWLL